MNGPSSAERDMTILDLKNSRPFASMVLIMSFAWACCSSDPVGVTSSAKHGAPEYIFQDKVPAFLLSSKPRKIRCGLVLRESKFLIICSSDSSKKSSGTNFRTSAYCARYNSAGDFTNGARSFKRTKRAEGCLRAAERNECSPRRKDKRFRGEPSSIR